MNNLPVAATCRLIAPLPPLPASAAAAARRAPPKRHPCPWPPACLATAHRELDNQFDCVATPAEYLQAFEARAPRCVSDELYGRVSMGPTEADVKGADTTNVLAHFWSGPDVLAKYLRVGYPEVGAGRQAVS